MDEPVQTNIRLPQSLKMRLEALAIANFRSTTQQLAAILTEHFARLDSDAADKQSADSAQPTAA